MGHPQENLGNMNLYWLQTKGQGEPDGQDEPREVTSHRRVDMGQHG